MIISLKLYASVFLEKVIYQAPASPVPGTNGLVFFCRHRLPPVICLIYHFHSNFLSNVFYEFIYFEVIEDYVP